MYKIYQIEYDDTLDTIASKTNTTKENIKKINGFESDSDLVVGSLIIVPNASNELFKSHKVKQGESIYSIARMHDIDPDTLLLINGLSKNDYIYPNQEITVPNDDLSVYVTKNKDTIKTLLNHFGIDANTLNNENDRIFVVEDQLIVHKKGSNN